MNLRNRKNTMSRGIHNFEKKMSNKSNKMKGRNNNNSNNLWKFSNILNEELTYIYDCMREGRIKVSFKNNLRIMIITFPPMFLNQQSTRVSY
jgi:hypothetical protein